MSFCIHLVVLLLPDSWSNWNLEKLVFEERGKLQYYPGKNQEQRGEPTNHQLTFSDTLLSNKNKKTTMNTQAPIVTSVVKSSDWKFILTELDDFSTLTTSISPDLAASSSCFSISDPVEGGSSVKQV